MESARIVKSLLVAELTAIVLGSLAFVCVASGAVLLSVKPPGEAALCTEEIWKNLHKSGLKVCKGLYTGIFTLDWAMAIGLVAIGLYALTPACIVLWGCKRPTPSRMCKSSVLAMLADLVFIAVTWFPQMLYLWLSITTAAALAPVDAHEFWLEVANWSAQKTDERHIKGAMQMFYDAYASANEATGCLILGSFTMHAVFWVCWFDIARAIAMLLVGTVELGEDEIEYQVVRLGRTLCQCCSGSGETDPAAKGQLEEGLLAGKSAE